MTVEEAMDGTPALSAEADSPGWSVHAVDATSQLEDWQTNVSSGIDRKQRP